MLSCGNKMLLVVEQPRPYNREQKLLKQRQNTPPPPPKKNNVAKLFVTERIAFNYFQHCKWGKGGGGGRGWRYFSQFNKNTVFLCLSGYRTNFGIILFNRLSYFGILPAI